ncbi:MAG: glycosyltransferase [Peptococcaceae bacterium]|nr:glycosyltransferase [Peptococcaceae bacterium]
MRVLILSCNTGQGHNSCAKALQEVFLAKGAHCEIVDALGFVSAGFSRLISAGHVRMYRYFPKVFSLSYHYSELHPTLFAEEAKVYRVLSLGTARLAHFLRQGNYDVILCVHVFSALMVTDVMRKSPLPSRSYFVATDYTCSPSTEESVLDGYFIPSKRLADDFCKGTITAGKILPVGIPVRQEFYRHEAVDVAKDAFAVAPGHKHLVVMTGSMGCGPVVSVSKRIAKGLADDQEMTIVCGTNKRLNRRLTRYFARSPRIHVRGYEKNVSLLLDSADLFLTKPGGISVTEAATKRVPMVLMDAVAGCETYNCRYYLMAGGAITEKNRRRLAAETLALLADGERCERMAAALALACSGNAAEAVYAECVRKK